PARRRAARRRARPDAAGGSLRGLPWNCIYIQYRGAWQGRSAYAWRGDLHTAAAHNRAVPMLRYAAPVVAAIPGTAAAILRVAPAAAAETGDPGLQIWVNPGMFSHHEKDDREYREKNYGLGVEAFFTPRHGVLAGTFMNSNDERSRYLGYHWRPLQL